MSRFRARVGRAAAAGLICATVLSAGCSAGILPSAGDEGIVEGALRAGVVPGEQDLLAPALLSRMDLQDAGLPPEMLQRTFDELPLYENPDPRGPCGATANDPGLDRAAAAVFATDDGRKEFAETVYDLPAPQAIQAIGDFRADLLPGCPPFVSQTPFGPETVELLRPVELGPIGDDRVGALARVTAPDGQTAYTMTELIRVGSKLVVLQSVGATPPLDLEMRSLAKAAAAKLQNLR